MIERIATEKLAPKCSECKRTIDEGDRYSIVSWGGGFDYRHSDCSDTSMANYERAKRGG